MKTFKTFEPSYPGGLDVTHIPCGLNDDEYRITMRKNGAFIATTRSSVDANAIVRALETHPKMVAALKAILDARESHRWTLNSDEPQCWDMARAALDEFVKS